MSEVLCCNCAGDCIWGGGVSDEDDVLDLGVFICIYVHIVILYHLEAATTGSRLRETPGNAGGYAVQESSTNSMLCSIECS